MMFCQNCGEELNENTQLCSNCGASVSTAANETDPDSSKGVSDIVENAIWNPNAASNWSIIFTPAFGSYLHAINWRTLGEQDRAKSAMVWFYFSLVMLVIYIFIGMFIADGVSGLVFWYLIIWYFSAGKPQAKYVKEKLGKDYPRRGWGKPLLIGIAAIIGYWFLSAAIVVSIGMIMA